MNLHSFTEYLKYKWKAKNRHGIHSPLVYAFIEDGLMPAKGADLQQTVANYFGDYHIEQAGIKQPPLCTALADMATSKTLILLPGIHKDETSTANWNKLKTDSHVRISIDLYSIGLLLFNKDVKEQQHFVLRYPV